MGRERPTAVSTGQFMVNGIAATFLAGNDADTITQGLNWEVIRGVPVTNGDLERPAWPEVLNPRAWRASRSWWSRNMPRVC